MVQVFIQINRTHCLNIDLNMSINQFKKIISHNLNIKTNNYFLVYAGKILDKDKNLIDYDIHKESTIYLNYKPF